MCVRVCVCVCVCIVYCVLCNVWGVTEHECMAHCAGRKIGAKQASRLQANVDMQVFVIILGLQSMLYVLSSEA